MPGGERERRTRGETIVREEGMRKKGYHGGECNALRAQEKSKQLGVYRRFESGRPRHPGEKSFWFRGKGMEVVTLGKT